MLNHTSSGDNTQPHVFQCFTTDGKASSTNLIKDGYELIYLCKEYNLKGLSCVSINPVSSSKIKTENITEVNNILIDVDVRDERKKNGVSTPEDKEKTKETAYAIKKELDEKINLRVSMLVDSGNGFHIYIPIKVSNEPGVKEKLSVLEQQLKKFDNDVCQIDCISKDIARRVKIPGTWNVKEGISKENYRLCNIIEKEKDAITKAVVSGNTDVFNSLSPVQELEVEVQDLPVDPTIDLGDILKADLKAQRLFDGCWKDYGYKSRSEAEESLIVILLSKGLPEERVRNALKMSKIGKWKTASKQYQNTSITKAKQFLQNRPNAPHTPNIPNNPNIPNINDKSYLIKHYLEKEKRPFQSIGRGLNNGVCYIGTYVTEDNGRSRNAVVTSDRKIYIDLRDEKNQTGTNHIKTDFNLNYREDFYFDVLDSCWENDSIKKWLFENYTVDIKKLYKLLIEINKKFMIYEDERCHIYIALDILRSFFFFLFDANSRTFNHAEPGSGKTNQLMIYRGSCFHPIGSPDFSSASIYRIIESTGGTILIDDLDDLPEEDKQKIIRHIKVNYKPFKALRSDGGRRFRPQGYNAYSHLMFNNVEGIGYDPITMERVIEIRLLKHRDAKDINIDFRNPIFTPIRNDLYVCLLQYWKQVKETYETLKVKDFSARELELFKPLFAIAKIIGDDVYNKIFGFAKEYFEQADITDLDDDWEFLLYEYLWNNTKDLVDDEDKTRDFSVKTIAEAIVTKKYSSLEKGDYETKRHQLECFIGGKLSTIPIFKKRRPNNKVFYEINRRGLKQILETKRWLGVLGVLGGLVVKQQNDGFAISDEYKDIVSKIETGMQTKMVYDWSINEICDAIGFSSMENRKLVDDVLRGLTSDPHNPTDIKRANDDEHYHLTTFKTKGDE